MSEGKKRERTTPASLRSPVAALGAGQRPLAAVIGSATEDGAERALALSLGEALIDAGFRLISGGRGGVMAAASEGARRSARYREGDVIGVLPGYDPGEANPYVDVILTTGMGHARNVVIVASAQVVFALGGRTGTLSEMAFAWTLGKPIVCVADPEAPAESWSTELAGRRLDARRDDRVHGPLLPREAVALGRSLLGRRLLGQRLLGRD